MKRLALLPLLAFSVACGSQITEPDGEDPLPNFGFVEVDSFVQDDGPRIGFSDGGSKSGIKSRDGIDGPDLTSFPTNPRTTCVEGSR